MEPVVKRLRLWLLLPLLFVAAVAVVAMSLPLEERPLLDSLSSWNVAGQFVPVSVPQQGAFADDDAAVHWFVPKLVESGSGQGRIVGDGSGKLFTEPFLAPGWVRLMVIGDLTRPGNEVYFRSLVDGKLLPVRARADGYYWRRITLSFPSDWVGTPVQLVARSGPRDELNWFGVSNPIAVNTGRVLLSQVRALLWLPVFGFALFLFLLPGLPLASLLGRIGMLESYLIVSSAIVLSCLAGYATFWAYFFNRTAGLAVGWALLANGAVAFVFELRASRFARSQLLSSDVLTPLALMALVGAFFLSLLLSVDQAIPYRLDIRTHFLEFVLAYDNELPFYFADSLYNGNDPRAIALGWQSSDRPPLQAGLLLLQMPFANLATDRADYALVASSALQCAWVPAIWSLWAAARLARRRAGLALLLVTLSGFALVNSLFTWPKLLSAALVVIAVTLALFRREGRESAWPLSRAVAFGLTAALASLSHAGVAFTLLPLGLLLLVPRYYPGLSRLFAAGSVYLLMLCPWVSYQTYYDPPGNKLVRQHLAGDRPTWQPDKSLARNLVAAYGSVSAGEIVHNKLENLRMFFMASQEQYHWPEHGTPVEWPVGAIGLRRCDFMCLFWSLGLLNLAWPLAVASWWRRSADLDPTLGFTVPALGLAAVAVWVVLMFGPASTVIHQGSYATVLLLFAALAAWLATLPGRLPYVLLVGQGTVFALGWLLTLPANQFGMPNVVAIPFAVLFFILLVKFALGTEISKKPPRRKTG
jgi:hypothetical protein